MSYCEKEGSDGRKRLWVGLSGTATSAVYAVAGQAVAVHAVAVHALAEWHPTVRASIAGLFMQLEEEIQEDLKWCVEVKHVLHSGKSDFQTMELIQSGPFGKVWLQLLHIRTQGTQLYSWWCEVLHNSCRCCC